MALPKGNNITFAIGPKEYATATFAMMAEFCWIEPHSLVSLLHGNFEAVLLEAIMGNFEGVMTPFMVLQQR